MKPSAGWGTCFRLNMSSNETSEASGWLNFESRTCILFSAWQQPYALTHRRVNAKTIFAEVVELVDTPS